MKVQAGIVPGEVIDLDLDGLEYTVRDVLTLAGEEIGRKRGLGEPAFVVHDEEYDDGDGNTRIDIPQVNGVLLAEAYKDEEDEEGGTKYRNIQWDHFVADGDVVLIVPKITGNQIVINVTRIPGTSFNFAVYASGEEEGGEDAGTVKAGLRDAGIFLEEGDVVTVNGLPADLDSFLNEGDKVVVDTTKRA